MTTDRNKDKSVDLSPFVWETNVNFDKEIY